MSQIDSDSTVNISDLVDSVATLLDSLSNADFNNLGEFLEDLTSAVDVTSAITTITDSLGVYSNLESALRYAVTVLLEKSCKHFPLNKCKF